MIWIWTSHVALIFLHVMEGPVTTGRDVFVRVFEG